MPEQQPTPILEYQPRAEADPYRVREFNWQNYPLASGALYAVVTVSWAVLWLAQPDWEYRWHRWSGILSIGAALLWGLVQSYAAFPLLRRARKYGRPVWLETLCFIISALSLIVLLVCVVVRMAKFVLEFFGIG